MYFLAQAVAFGIGQISTSNPTRQADNGFSGDSIAKHRLSCPIWFARVTQTFVLGWLVGQAVLVKKSNANKHKHNIQFNQMLFLNYLVAASHCLWNNSCHSDKSNLCPHTKIQFVCCFSCLLGVTPIAGSSPSMRCTMPQHSTFHTFIFNPSLVMPSMTN